MKVFVSSVHDDFRAEREALHGWLSAHGATPWVFEHIATKAEWDALGAERIRRVCLENARSADLCVALFGASYGSSAADHDAGVSCTALEVFEAFHSLRPMRAYVLAPGPSSGPLAELLTMLRDLAPDAVSAYGTRAALVDAVKRDLAPYLRRRPRRLASGVANRYFTASIALHLPRERADRIEMPAGHPGRPRTFDRDRTMRWIAQAETPSAPAQQRVDAAWVALGELACVPFTESRFEEHRPLWSRALDAWDDAAAWYGLHSLDDMGKLAALRTLLRVKAMQAAAREIGALTPRNLLATSPPVAARGWAELYRRGSPLASAYYSLALQSTSTREWFLERADAWVDVGLRGAALEGSERSRTNLLSIRAHVRVRQGRLADAITMMEGVVAAKREASLDTLPESQGDLGMLYARARRYDEALAALRPAVGALEAAGDRPGFTARAKRQYAFTLLAAGAPWAGLHQLGELEALCAAFSVHDQWRRVGEDVAALVAEKAGALPESARDALRDLVARGASLALGVVAGTLVAEKTDAGYVYRAR